METGRRGLRPASGWGLARARRLWRVAVAIWVVSTVAFLPALWVVEGKAGGALGRLPRHGAAAGDVLLIVADAARAVGPAFLLAVASGLAVLWMFTILWQAGVVSWELWSGGRRVRLGEVLGLGMVAWWPYARLSLVALGVLGVALWGLWRGLATAIREAFQAMAESRVEGLLLGGLCVSLLLLLVVFAATLRAAWLLGRPRRRSALAAWWRGLFDTLRTPLASLGTVLLWAVPALLATVVPITVGALVPAARPGWLLPVLTEAAAALRAFCWVGLFTSFASASGLLAPAAGGEAAAAEEGSGGPSRR